MAGQRIALFVSCLLAEAAKVWLRAGNTRQPKLALKEAFEVAEKTGDGFYIAEMHRLHAEILWTCDKDAVGAEIDLEKRWKSAAHNNQERFACARQ